MKSGGKGIDLEEIVRGVKGEHYQDAVINFSKIKKYAKWIKKWK